ncbi:MAG: hypothetical protein QOH38_861 [Thermoleophilaceae bacterium]|nr:hypothetical protein [Thermoleophilaceae bacterium]
MPVRGIWNLAASLNAGRLLPRSVALAALAACCAAAPAGAQSVSAASRTDQTRHEARVLAREIAAPWRGTKRQYGNGRFVDEVGGYSSYGEAVLGYSLISEGLRESDSKMIGTGLRAMRYATDRYSSSNGAVSVFQNMAVGLTYRLAQRRLRSDGRWTRIRDQVESYMRRQPLVRFRSHPSHFANHLLVESLNIFTFVRSGVTSSQSSAMVGPGREQRYSWAREFIQHGVPHLFTHAVRPSGGDNTLLLSDPPDKPLAYQGLSIGLYARAMEMLGSDAGTASYFTLRRALEASWRLTAPDGDLSYYGRNQEEAFSLAATAYGARIAETLPGTSTTRARRYEELARRALQRIRDVHLGGPAGIWVIPALKINADTGGDAVDHGGYAPYGGLALMFINAIADMEAPGQGQKGASIFADHNGTAILGRRESLFATQRIGPLWLAVRAGPSADRPTDVRYDGGLLRLKLRDSTGHWQDLVPTRPRLPISGADSAGPLIIRNDRGTAVFAGDRIRAGGSAGMRMIGGYRRLRGVPDVSRSADERFRPLSCGVEVSFPVRKNDIVEYSVYLADEGHFERGGGQVTSGGTTVSASPRPRRIVIGNNYRSSTNPEVLRARLRWHSHAKQRMHVRICAS